jgi:hypothetical protein
MARVRNPPHFPAMPVVIAIVAQWYYVKRMTAAGVLR